MSIWDNDGDDRYKLRRVRQHVINTAEKNLGVKLPETYIELIKEQNGGSLIYNAHPAPSPTSWADDHVPVNGLMGIGKDDGILQSAYFIQEWDMPAGLVLLDGDGHTWIALDYRQVKSDPPIIFIDNENGQILQLADNFDQFIAGLYKENEEEIDVFEEAGEFSLTREEVEAIFESDDIMAIIQALDHISYAEDVEPEYVTAALDKFSTHPDARVRETVATRLFDFFILKKSGITVNFIQELSDRLIKDSNADVRMMAEALHTEMRETH